MDVSIPQSKNILVVDDDPQILRLVSMMIHKLRPNDNVVTALTCGDALSRLQSEHFDMVISDYNLPDGNGKTVLKHTPSSSYRVGISGSLHEQDFEKTCDRYLSKPFGVNEINGLFL